MSNNSKAFKSTIVFLGQGLSALINFCFFPYLARALSIEDYGSYGQTLLMFDLIKSVFIMGLTNVVFIQLSKNENNFNSVFKSNFLFSLLCGISGALFLILSSSSIASIFSNQELSNYLKLLSISIIFQIPYDYLNSVLLFTERIKQSVLITITINLLKIILLIISIQYFHSMNLVFGSIAIVSILQLMLVLVFIPFRNYYKGNFERSIVKTQFKMALPLVFSSLLGYLLKFTDGLMVSSMLSVKDYAIFRNGAFEIPFISMVYASISSILLPEFSKLSASGGHDRIINIKRKTSSISASLIVPPTIFILFFSNSIVRLIFGEDYSDSSTIFWIINLLLLIRINDYQDVLILHSKTKFILIANVLCLLLNISIGYLLIGHLGSVGAAIATTLSIYTFAAVLLFKSTSLLNIGFWDFFNLKILVRIFLFSLVVAIVAYLAYSLNPNKLLLFPIGILYLCVVYLLLYRSGSLDIQALEPLFHRFKLNTSKK